MIQIAVVEDDRSDRARVVDYIRQFSAANHEPIKTTEFENAERFLALYRPVFDAVLLDIQMPYLDGMRAAERLREVDQTVPLVFITNMSNFAVQGYAVNALDFVVKPVTYYAFSAMLTRVIRVAKARSDEIVLKTVKGSVKLPLDWISHIEAEGHQVVYHTEKGEYRLWETLKQQEARLPGDRFVRCSSYCIVNLKHIDGVSGNSLRIGDAEAAITRTHKQKFMARLLEYYGDYF